MLITGVVTAKLERSFKNIMSSIPELEDVFNDMGLIVDDLEDQIKILEEDNEDSNEKLSDAITLLKDIGDFRYNNIDDIVDDVNKLLRSF